MYAAMDVADMLINNVNASLDITKFISWNEMHQNSAKDLFEQAKKSIEDDEDAITMIDWCFDINTLNAMSALFKYAQENNEGIIISYEYALVVFCKNKDVEKEVLKKLPKPIKDTCQYNMTNIEIYDESCVISYYNKQVQIPFGSRPEYIYKLMTNSYE